MDQAMNIRQSFAKPAAFNNRKCAMQQRLLIMNDFSMFKYMGACRSALYEYAPSLTIIRLLSKFFRFCSIYLI